MRLRTARQRCPQAVRRRSRRLDPIEVNSALSTTRRLDKDRSPEIVAQRSAPYTGVLASPLRRTGYGRFRSCVATVIRKQWFDHIGRGCLVDPDAPCRVCQCGLPWLRGPYGLFGSSRPAEPICAAQRAQQCDLCENCQGTDQTPVPLENSCIAAG